MIKGVVFDMDGLLIDSEPLWYEAMIAVFGQVGTHLTFDLCRQTQGLRLDDLVNYWYNKKPWQTPSKEEVGRQLVEKVIELVEQKGEKMPGVDYVLGFVKEKGVKIALASSSPIRLIQAAVKRFQLENYFDGVCSAEFEKHGKPHPAVYLKAAKILKLSPWQCLAFEDSFNGLLSAKSAKMECVCVPDKSQKDDPRFKIADEILFSLSEFNEELWQRLNKN